LQTQITTTIQSPEQEHAQEVEMQKKQRLEQEQAIRDQHINAMKRLVQSEELINALRYYATHFPPEFKTLEPQALRDQIWNELNKEDMAQIQELQKQGKCSKAWKLLNDIADTQTSPEYRSLAASIAIDYSTSQWAQGQYKRALEICEQGQKLSEGNPELTEYIAQIQSHWEEIKPLLQKIQQSAQSMLMDQACDEPQINALLEIYKSLQDQKGKEKMAALGITNLKLSTAMEKTPEWIEVVERKPEIVPVLKKSLKIVAMIQKIVTMIQKTPELAAALEKSPEIAAVLEGLPERVPTLIQFPAAAPILKNFPNLDPILGKASEIGMSFLRVASYTCGNLSNEMLELQHAQTGLEFVLIPGGTFEMGSNDGYPDNTAPMHQVHLSPYFMSKTLVTQAVWERIMDTNPSKFKGDDHPVETVSWNDCAKFCKKVGLSLPTEAQWEYACRAGSKTLWCFGDDEAQLEEYAWYAENSGRQTHPVAQKKPNAYGLYDMHGNLWELCWDWKETYPSNSVTDPVGPRHGSYRIERGGSWDTCASVCRSTLRHFTSPGDLTSTAGFRVCGVYPKSQVIDK